MRPHRSLHFKGKGKDDPAFAQMLALTGKTANELCFKCKYGRDVCSGVSACVFESNCFPAKQEKTCRVCKKPTVIGQFVTKLIRGQYAGNYVHQVRALPLASCKPRALRSDVSGPAHMSRASWSELRSPGGVMDGTVRARLHLGTAGSVVCVCGCKNVMMLKI